jgi:hypothetical protein
MTQSEDVLLSEHKREWLRAAALIGEGICPRCERPLIRDDANNHGRCDPCRKGWRLWRAGPDDEWLTTPDCPYVITESWL